MRRFRWLPAPFLPLSSNTRRNLSFALAVLVLHLGLGYGLLSWKRVYPAGRPLVVSMRLQALWPKPPPPESPRAPPDLKAPPPHHWVPAFWIDPAEPSPPRNAITATNTPFPAAAAMNSSPDPSSNPASGPLNLALPKTWKAEERLSPAQQAVHDPRANSPRYSATEALARRMANQAEVIQLADGGTMTRYPDGRCTRTLPNRANALVPMDPHLQSGIAHGGNCFDDKPGSALQHARPR